MDLAGTAKTLVNTELLGFAHCSGLNLSNEILFDLIDERKLEFSRPQSILWY